MAASPGKRPTRPPRSPRTRGPRCADRGIPIGRHVGYPGRPDRRAGEETLPLDAARHHQAPRSFEAHLQADRPPRPLRPQAWPRWQLLLGKDRQGRRARQGRGDQGARIGGFRSEGTSVIPEDQIAELVRKHFPLTPRGIIKHLDLLKPIYKQTARHGHFGRKPGPDGSFSWEKTDKAAALAKDAGTKVRG